MRLLIADDHTLFRDALVQYIERAEPDTIFLLAKDFFETYELLKQEPLPDLVLLDKKMPGMKGLVGLETIRKKYPDIPIVLMSGIAEPEDVSEAMELGAKGFFPKTMTGSGMLKAIEFILAGEKFLPVDPTTNKIQPSYYTDDGGEPLSSVSKWTQKTVQDSYALTPREKEVLGYLLTGLSNKEIGSKLNLQEVTIKLHVRGVCQKLDVQNRTQAALKAVQLGFPAAKDE